MTSTSFGILQYRTEYSTLYQWFQSGFAKFPKDTGVIVLVPVPCLIYFGRRELSLLKQVCTPSTTSSTLHLNVLADIVYCISGLLPYQPVHAYCSTIIDTCRSASSESHHPTESVIDIRVSYILVSRFWNFGEVLSIAWNIVSW